MKTTIRLSAIGAIVFAGVACEPDGEFLFQNPVEGVPAVLDLKGPDGGPLAVNTITSLEEARAAAIYAEIGPNATAERPGATFEFLGTGGDVCVFIDPELVHWNQSVSQQAPVTRWRIPDNVYDDGDLDVNIGLSVYYRGTPGVRMGGFEVQYTDDLDNDVEIELVACKNSSAVNPNAYAGRGSPEFCSVLNTQPGVSYTVALDAFSMPWDDARLGFGILVAEGPCAGTPQSLTRVASIADGVTNTLPVDAECVIIGEALEGEGEGKIIYGYDEATHPAVVNGVGTSSVEFEENYCTSEMNTWCNAESQAMRAAGLICDYTGRSGNPDRRCFCGDRGNTPSPGARR